MRTRVVARTLLLLWLALFAAIALPWGDVQDHTHWYKVAWVPFASSPFRPVDIVGNVVAFIPFGALIVYAADWRRRPPWPTGIVLAILLSTAAESVQLFSHMRFPSATDVTTNASGAAIGMWAARYASRLRRQ